MSPYDEEERSDLKVQDLVPLPVPEALVRDETEGNTLQRDGYIDANSLEIQWISFDYDSPDDRYSVAREAIREFLELDYDEQIAGWVVPASIAIGFYDLDHDGVDEIIAVITGAGFVGSRNTGTLYVFKTDGESIIAGRDVRGTMLALESINDPDSQQIGLVRNEAGWDYLYHNGWLAQTVIDEKKDNHNNTRQDVCWRKELWRAECVFV
ncbi:MAG: hypothetical protein FWE32_10435 [Oscillospiraceae bacterium]|nr:hypothetical protein [Oscillospiraceae bacterium]